MNTNGFTVGDHVTIGKGRTLWRVTGFWVNGFVTFASLSRPDRAWVNTSSTTDRLRPAAPAEDVAS